MKIINEIQKYEYGCVMLYFDFPDIKKIHQKINPSDVYTSENDNSFGLELEPHTTLLFGLHSEVGDKQIKDVLSHHAFGTCQIKNASLFENEEYDVLKFDVNGNGLHECHADLCKYPHTTSYPNYHPHLTIGYIKKGLGQKQVELFKNMGYSLTPQYAVYSKPDGSETKFKINIKH
jgi:2'-5' RNA ligase